MIFYLGTHIPSWLQRVHIPLFVSVRTLRWRKKLKLASCRWALDSGGFSELSMHGRWTIAPKTYATLVARFSALMGRLDWAAAQDWMCEPQILAKTGLSVKEHQARTVANFIELKSIAPGARFAPVIQGWEISDYHRCVEDYDKAGVNLHDAPAVGIGSVCRRQRTREGIEIIKSLAQYGFALHGFGVKTTAVRQVSHLLASADSMAWSLGARFNPPLPGHRHKNCANCLEYALRWRARVIAAEGMRSGNTQ